MAVGQGRGAGAAWPWGGLWCGARRALLRGGVAACVALLLLWASLFLYGSFYFSCLPPAALLRPVHFAFRSDCPRPSPELCSFPTANVSLLGENRQQVLLYGQLYRISLELELPESPPNRALGMFMVNISCYGPHGRPIASAARATMLHYRSPLLRTLHTVAFAGLFLGGFAEQTQTLEVELCSRYREDPYLPTAGAVLQIQSKRVQFYGARLRVQARFSGIRYLLHHFPVTSALLGVAGNFTFLLLLLLGGTLRWGRGRLWPRPTPPPPETTSAPPPEEEEEEEGGGGEGEAPPPTSGDGPETLGASEETTPPLLTAAPPPPSEEKEGEGGEGQDGAPPSPTPRPRPVCASS